MRQRDGNVLSPLIWTSPPPHAIAVAAGRAGKPDEGFSMSAMTDAGRRGFALIERLLHALTDPARRERAAVAVILGYVAVWTLYAALAKGSQDIHADMSEQFTLSRELAWGYSKHP